MAEGDAFAEENSHIRQEVVEGVVEAYVLHRVLYPQVHENGFKKKKKKKKNFGVEVRSLRLLCWEMRSSVPRTGKPHLFGPRYNFTYGD
jgi:hypothetical protein